MLNLELYPGHLSSEAIAFVLACYSHHFGVSSLTLEIQTCYIRFAM